ncbi:VOC family protein [Actinospica durhamensis]|uniref:VOC family protein n=1 Tax=Actinospica durhamensis TaxID=1508375 RepID=A0A941ISL1_9ACTN|nr:VOC family protein [Actinospica durhamensis]MBR7833321.1 VOC family protein [Actinospica durhamensis]
MLKSLMYVTVYVSDQDRALEFYTEKLGLSKRIDYTGADGRFLTVAPGDASVEIILWPSGPGQQRPEADAARPGVVPGSVFLESDDLAKDFEAFRSRGVSFVQDGPTPYPFGILLTALDPDGNRVELRQPRRGGGTES